MRKDSLLLVDSEHLQHHAQKEYHRIVAAQIAHQVARLIHEVTRIKGMPDETIHALRANPTVCRDDSVTSAQGQHRADLHESPRDLKGVAHQQLVAVSCRPEQQRTYCAAKCNEPSVSRR